MTTNDIALEMERRYHCRYEAGDSIRSGLLAFPVTHRLDGRAIPYSDGGVAAWAHIGINNHELLNWCIRDKSGRTLIHGSERNLADPRKPAAYRAGYRKMIRRALEHVRVYGAVRVWPHDRSVIRLAGSNPWTKLPRA